MTTPDTIIAELQQLAASNRGNTANVTGAAETAIAPVAEGEPPSLIGLFQAFRPDGIPDAAFEKVPGGGQFASRLNRIYDATRNHHRADAMKDAYFVVRNPPMLRAERAEELATELLHGLNRLAKQLNQVPLQGLFDPLPQVRVLEGKPPKHPRADNEKADLLFALQRDLPHALKDNLTDKSLGSILGEALYFVACDPLLCEYLRWPLQSIDSIGDPLAPYFELWRHGVKYRIFSNKQIDFYLPRRSDGSLLDAGQFAGQG